MLEMENEDFCLIKGKYANKKLGRDCCKKLCLNFQNAQSRKQKKNKREEAQSALIIRTKKGQQFKLKKTVCF